MDIGRIIKEERERQGLSLRDLADKSGASFSFLGSIERGEKKPDYLKAYKILTTLFYGETAEKLLKSYLTEKDFKEIGKDLAVAKTVNNIVSNINIGEPLQTVKIPVYGSVSAGNGCIAYGDITDYSYTTAHDYIEGTFALKVVGDSMEQRIPEGALVEVIPLEKLGHELHNKDIGVFITNGDEGIVKQFFKEDDFYRLVSFNPAYRDIIIPFTRDDFRIVGKVKGMRIVF